MAGFASGVIDSFQYYGTAIALPFTGWMIDRHGWGVWYPIMASFGAIGGLAMLMVMRKQRRMHTVGDLRAASVRRDRLRRSMTATGQRCVCLGAQRRRYNFYRRQPIPKTSTSTDLSVAGRRQSKVASARRCRPYGARPRTSTRSAQRKSLRQFDVCPSANRRARRLSCRECDRGSSLCDRENVHPASARKVAQPPKQPQHHMTGELRARLSRRFQNGGHLVIGQAGNHRPDHHSHWNSRPVEFRNGLQSCLGGEVRGSRMRCNFRSGDVTEMLTATASCAANSRSTSMSRVMRRFFVMIPTGLRNFASTWRQPRVIFIRRSTG